MLKYKNPINVYLQKLIFIYVYSFNATRATKAFLYFIFPFSMFYNMYKTKSIKTVERISHCAVRKKIKS